MELRADTYELTQFIGALFKFADSGTFASLRAFHQTDSKAPAEFIRAIKINGSLEVLVAAATQAATEAANRGHPVVFAPPVCTFSNPDRGRAQDLANGLTLSVEIDEGDTVAARRRLEGLLGPATIVLASGGEWVDPATGEIHAKLHLHWRLAEPTRDQEDHEKLRFARDMAGRLAGADPTGKPMVHPLRWPGSWNLKGDKPVLARIVQLNETAEIILPEAVDALADAIEAAGMAAADLPRSGNPTAPLDDLVSAFAAIPNPGSDVHYDTWIRWGYACFNSAGSEAGQGLWETWARKSDKFDAAEQEAAWRRIHRAILGGKASLKIGAGSIFWEAVKYGWKRPERELPEAPPDESDDPGYWQSVDLDAPLTPPAAPTLPAPHPDIAPPVLDPWNALRPVAFPLAAIPPALAAMVDDRARVIGADPAALAWAALSACSAAINGCVRLQMKRHDNWSVPPAIWVALVGAPSSKKTPIVDAAWAPLHRAQATDLARHKLALASWRSLSKAERAVTPEPNPARRLVSHDATMEALQGILAEQDRGIGVLRDELAGWIGSMEKYAPGKGGAADRAFALQSYNGVPHVVDRIGRGTLSIDNLLTTMCGGIQPDRLRQFGDLTDDGLWQRFAPIIVAPASIGVDRAAGGEVADYDTTIRHLLEVPGGLRLHLSEDAHAVREDVQRRIFHLEQAEVLGPRFVGFCGKLVGLWGRLALVMHLLVNRDTNIVSLTTAEAARSLLFKSVLPNAARVYTAMGGAGGDLEATQSIAGYILTKHLKRIVMSDLTSNVRVCRHQPAEQVRKLLSPLEAGGWLRPEKDWQPMAWVVADAVHIRFADRAAHEANRREQVRALITANLGGDNG